MASSAQKGAAYKAKTKKWLEAMGYQVAQMERVHRIFAPGRNFAVKRDQFGADLLAMSGTRLIFVQAKGAKAASSDMLGGVREFGKHVFPPCAERWVVGWPFRARVPKVLDAATGEYLEPPYA